MASAQAQGPWYWDEDRADHLNTAFVSGQGNSYDASFSNGHALDLGAGANVSHPTGGQYTVKIYIATWPGATGVPTVNLPVVDGSPNPAYYTGSFVGAGVHQFSFTTPGGWYFDAYGDFSAPNSTTPYLDRVDILSGAGGCPNDADCDGLPDDVDPCPNDPTNTCCGNPLDSDCDGCEDADEGIACNCPGDQNCDGCADADEGISCGCPGDANCDGCADADEGISCGCPNDADCDGIIDADDPCPNDPTNTCCGDPLDSDCDGCPDAEDQAPNDPTIGCAGCPGDSDCDGCLDVNEGVSCGCIGDQDCDGCPDNAEGISCNCPGDLDCDGCPDAEDENPTNPQIGCIKNCNDPNDFDCDGCPNDQDQQPWNPQIGCGGPPPPGCPGDQDCDGCPDYLDSWPQDPTRGCEGSIVVPPPDEPPPPPPPSDDKWPELEVPSFGTLWNLTRGQIEEANLSIAIPLPDPRYSMSLTGQQVIKYFTFETVPAGQDDISLAWNATRVQVRGWLNLVMAVGTMISLVRSLAGGDRS